ncbi:hypothetical protein MKW94_026450, partial [Papaver nudicaule]|nr:hypothetical protein [Papaver nudicaule]
HIPDLEYPNETRIVRIKQGRADHFNSNWSMKLDKDARMKLPTSQMWGGYEPQVYYHSEHRVPVPETDPKVEFNEGEDMLDDEWIEILKMREKLFSSLSEKDIPEEAMDIEEDHTAVWDARWENLQLVKVCRGPTGVEAAEA